MVKFPRVFLLCCVFCLFSPYAEASFVVWWQCEHGAAGLDHPDRELKSLDCFLALSKEIKESVPGLSYMPTTSPNDSFQVASGASVGTQLLLLNPSAGYVFGTGSDFNTLLAGNTFTGASNITDLSIGAIPIDAFASFAGAADAAEATGDLSVAFQNVLWNSGQVLYTGGASSIALDTTGMAGGEYALRIRVADAANGGTVYGLGILQVVPEPSTLALLGIGVLGLIGWAGSSRRKQ